MHKNLTVAILYGGPGGRATRRRLCDDDDASIDDDDATIDNGDATIDDGDAIIYQLSNTVITLRARRTGHQALIRSTWPRVMSNGIAS